MNVAGRLFANSNRLPLLLQSESAECGLACLAMVASAHGHEIDVNEIRHRFHISRKGTTLRDLVRFAQKLGLSARALRLEPVALGRLQCPAILHMQMDHFVVLKRMRGDVAIVHDPALGFRSLSAEQVNRRFTGVAVELTPSESFKSRKPGPRLGLRALVGQLPLSQILPKALLLSLAFQLLLLAAPFYVQLVVDRGVTQGDADALLPLAVGFFMLILLRGAVASVRAQVLLAFGGLASGRLVANLVRHMLRLPLCWFESREIATLQSRISSTQPIRDLITEGLAAAVVDGLMALLTITVAILFAPALASVVLAGFILCAFVKWWQVSRAMEREHEHIEAFCKAQQEFIETVRAIATVKLFRKEADRERRWSDRHVQTVNARYAVDLIKARSDLARDVIQAFVLGLIVYLGAGHVIAGSISLGMLIAFITYQQMFADSSAKLLDFAGRYRLLDVHLGRIEDVALSEPEPEGSAHGDSLGPFAGALSATDLVFRYGELEEPVLDGISIDVKAGEFVAITGPSGGGKTTLLKLLLGLLQPTAGRICYDGRPVQTIGVSAIRERIGVVMQDDVLLSGSIAQNITFFDAEPDSEWMRECARLAAIDDDISRFPMGYNTLVGDLGAILSGGQRQRVLLARALYRRPSMLFMDEGTSSLDTEREREVNRNLRGMKMTRIIIAHRKDTIGAADRILELSPMGLVPLGDVYCSNEN